MNYEQFLESKGYAENTIKTYTRSVNSMLSQYTLTDQSLKLYRADLLENCKPRSVNLHVSAINSYLDFVNSSCQKLKTVKFQQRTFLENVISFPDYEYLKGCLIKDNNMMWYFVVRFLGSTGARVSELLQIKKEHVLAGYIDIYGKGGKIRRIYIPCNLQIDALRWYEEIELDSGFVFFNSRGCRLTSKGVSTQLKHLADKYGLDPKFIYPHSFRHMFAKTFMDRNGDIALLADLLGHESIETTRIYLRKTANEQREIVNKTVDW